MASTVKAQETTVGSGGAKSENQPLVSLEMLQHVVKLSPFTNWSGTEVTEARYGYAEAKTPFRKDLTQHHGFLHGGIIGFLSDNVSAWAAATVVGDVLTADYSVKLLAPGKGDYFIARATVVKATRRLVAVESKIYAVTEGAGEPSEKLIAMGTATILPAALPTAR